MTIIMSDEKHIIPFDWGCVEVSVGPYQVEYSVTVTKKHGDVIPPHYVTDFERDENGSYIYGSEDDISYIYARVPSAKYKEKPISQSAKTLAENHFPVDAEGECELWHHNFYESACDRLPASVYDEIISRHKDTSLITLPTYRKFLHYAENTLGGYENGDDRTYKGNLMWDWLDTHADSPVALELQAAIDSDMALW